MRCYVTKRLWRDKAGRGSRRGRRFSRTSAFDVLEPCMRWSPNGGVLDARPPRPKRPLHRSQRLIAPSLRRASQAHVCVKILAAPLQRGPHITAPILPHRSETLFTDSYFGCIPLYSGGPPMRADLYRRCALTCLGFAGDTVDVRMKLVLFDMAQAWT